MARRLHAALILAVALSHVSLGDDAREFVHPVGAGPLTNIDQTRHELILSDGTEAAARIRHRLVRLDVDALKAGSCQEGEGAGTALCVAEEFVAEEFNVSPFPDVLLVAKTTIVRKSPFDNIWGLHATVVDLDGDDGWMTISVTNESPHAVNGDITTGRAIFRIKHINGPYHLIQELDAQKIRVGDDVVIVSPVLTN